jgi:hypothetical protein
MTLREWLAGDVQRVYEQVDALLDREDGLLMLFDGGRMVTYMQGFGASSCQLELLSVDLERAVRNVVPGQSTTNRRDRNREESKEEDDSGRSAVLGQQLGDHGRRNHGSVADGGGATVRGPDAADRNRNGAAPHVLRLASKTA